MKFLNNSMIWSLILCAGLVVSCKDDDEPGIPGGLALDKTEIAQRFRSMGKRFSCQWIRFCGKCADCGFYT